MSLKLWQHEPHRNIRASGRARPTDHWVQIIREQTDGSPEEIAARILGDMYCYTATRKRGGYDEARHEFFGDVAQLAHALKAYAKVSQDRLSLNDLDRLLEQFP